MAIVRIVSMLILVAGVSTTARAAKQELEILEPGKAAIIVIMTDRIAAAGTERTGLIRIPAEVREGIKQHLAQTLRDYSQLDYVESDYDIPYLGELVIDRTKKGLDIVDPRVLDAIEELKNQGIRYVFVVTQHPLSLQYSAGGVRVSTSNALFQLTPRRNGNASLFFPVATQLVDNETVKNPRHKMSALMYYMDEPIWPDPAQPFPADNLPHLFEYFHDHTVPFLVHQFCKLGVFPHQVVVRTPRKTKHAAFGQKSKLCAPDPDKRQ